MDYVYYRVYWAYRKKRESAKILSFLYMTMVFAFLFLPVAFSFCELLRDPCRRNDGCLLSIYLLIVLMYSYLRFFSNKKIRSINERFKENHLNQMIPDWWFFVFLPLGPHYPRQLFVYKGGKIFIFNSRGNYNPEGVIVEFCSCIKELKLTHKEIVDYLNAIDLYLKEEDVADYGEDIK